MDGNRQGNIDQKKKNWNSKAGEIQKKKREEGRGEREQTGSLAAVGRVSGEWHFSMWLAYGANCGSGAGSLGAGNQRRSGWLWQHLHRKGKADWAEGWYRCQPLAKSAICHGELAKSHWPRHVAKSGGRLVMTSHYELGAVLSTWPIPNSS